MSRWVVHLRGERRPCCVAVAVGHNVYSFDTSGDISLLTNTHTMTINVFNMVSLRWKTLPATREGQCPLQGAYTAVLIGDVIYIFGGFKYTFNPHGWNGEICNDLYAFDVDTNRWSRPKVSGTAPEKSQRHVACVLGNAMYIWGGYTRNYIYKLDTATMVWTFIDTRRTPELSSYTVNSATIIGTKMFVCHRYEKNISVFDTETNVWLSTPSAQLPSEGRCGCHSSFAYNGELYIFTRSLDGNVNELWKFNPETFSWRKVAAKGKGPRLMYAMCCCTVGDRIVLFGRQDRLTDLYILDMRPSLKELCKLAVIQHGLDQAELPHDIRWELAAMTNSNRTCKSP